MDNVLVDFAFALAQEDNTSAWSDKLEWVKRHLDDRTKNGAGEFGGALILFGSGEFEDWSAVLGYLLPGEKAR
jgi:hypothetical protein